MAEDEDSVTPRINPRRVQPLVLEPLGIAELEAYIAELRSEIARCEEAIARKQSHRSVADSFFRS